MNNEEAICAKSKKVTEKCTLRDDSFKYKIIRTALVCWSFFALGWSASMSGTTFPDLQILIGENLGQASWIFTAASFGALSGSCIGGFMYQRLNKVLLLAIATFGMGLSTLLTPLCTTLRTMVAVKLVAFFFGGILDTAGNAELPYIWGYENSPYMQSVHFGFSLGALVSPIVTGPFLTETAESCQQNLMSTLQSPLESGIDDKGKARSLNISLAKGEDFESDVKTTSNISLFNISDTCTDTFRNNNIQYAFLISAVITLTATVGAVVVFLKRDLTISPSNSVSENKNGIKEIKFKPPSKSMSVLWKVVFLTFISFLITAESVLEESFPGFFMIFGEKYLKWDVSSNVKAITLFWTSFGFGRLCGIFVASKCSSVTMLTTYLFLLGVSLVGFLLSTYAMLTTFVWIFIPMIGFFMSVLFPTVLSWTSVHVIHVSGKVSGLFMTSASLGGMVCPLIIGNLMEYMHPMWYVYILNGIIGGAIINYVIIKLLENFYNRNKEILPCENVKIS